MAWGEEQCCLCRGACNKRLAGHLTTAHQPKAHLGGRLQVATLTPLVTCVCQAQVAHHQSMLTVQPHRFSLLPSGGIRDQEAAVGECQAGGLQSGGGCRAAGQRVGRPAGCACQEAHQGRCVQRGVPVCQAAGVGLQF